MREKKTRCPTKNTDVFLLVYIEKLIFYTSVVQFCFLIIFVKPRLKLKFFKIKVLFFFFCFNTLIVHTVSDTEINTNVVDI